jgi:hypothetical protein
MCGRGAPADPIPVQRILILHNPILHICVWNPLGTTHANAILPACAPSAIIVVPVPVPRNHPRSISDPTMARYRCISFTLPLRHRPPKPCPSIIKLIPIPCRSTFLQVRICSRQCSLRAAQITSPRLLLQVPLYSGRMSYVDDGQTVSILSS